MLSSLLAVFIGGGVGSVLRWAVSMKMNPLNAHIPLGTLMVNLIGGFIIGLAMAIFTRMTHLDPTWKLLITTGFYHFKIGVDIVIEDYVRTHWLKTGLIVGVGFAVTAVGAASAFAVLKLAL